MAHLIEKDRVEKLATKVATKWWKSSKLQRSQSNNKGNDIHKRVNRRERRRPKFQALRYLLGNYQKVGIKYKCIIMLTINTIMSALPASMFCCGYDVCSGVGCDGGRGTVCLCVCVLFLCTLICIHVCMCILGGRVLIRSQCNLEKRLNSWRIPLTPIPFIRTESLCLHIHPLISLR